MKAAQPQAIHLSIVPKAPVPKPPIPENRVQTDTTKQTQLQASSHLASHPANHSISILKAVLGNLQDGFIIANPTGTIQQINQPAERICNLLSAETDQIPSEIWQVCRAALNRKDVLSFNKIGLDADIILPDVGTVRIRVQNINIADQPHLLIVLEDRQQTIRNKALSDATLYGLTDRETEIWQMRLRGDAYKEISTTLWISVDTVKKHVKNILAKQRSHLNEMEYSMMA
ncbi:MAG: helix-turn-helix transcriptional regulator [Cyanobacteria bacterium J06621_11]